MLVKIITSAGAYKACFAIAQIASIKTTSGNAVVQLAVDNSWNNDLSSITVKITGGANKLSDLLVGKIDESRTGDVVLGRVAKFHEGIIIKEDSA